MYGIEVMILVKIRFPSLRVTHYSLENNKQGRRANLYLYKEYWLAIAVRNEAYHHQITQYHNAKVKNMSFKFRDLVLWKIKATGNRDTKGKLAPKWDGLFLVIRVVKANTYHLQDMEGENLPRTRHSDYLKKYRR